MDRNHQGEGPLRLIIMVGDPGVGKSFSLRSALQDPHAWIYGRISPVKLYRQAVLSQGRLRSSC